MENIIIHDSLAPSRKTVEELRNGIFKQVEDGYLDPIKLNAYIKFYEKVFNGDDKKNNGLNHLIKDLVVDELQKAPERKEYFGFEVQVKESGSRYDFTNCNYPVLEELYEKKKELEEKIKEAETFLKAIKPGSSMIITDEDTGQQSRVFAPVKKSTTTPVFKLK